MGSGLHKIVSLASTVHTDTIDVNGDDDNNDSVDKTKPVHVAFMEKGTLHSDQESMT